MRILITGGAGFLGRALARAWEGQHELTVYSRDEQKQDRMRREFPGVHYALGDVTEERELTLAMAGHDAVVHAAAVKYIVDAERNVRETIRVNVEGSRSVLHAAARAKIETVVGISTDKAVDPLNTYGATKLLMERMFAEFDGHETMRAVCVRYGNVIGSTGSVLPLFMEQADAGRITVTDPTMTRFWLTSAEAVELVELGLNNDRRYSPVIVHAAESMRMNRAAVVARRAAGRSRIEIAVIGARPGEKQHEALISRGESVRTHGRPGQDARFYVMPATTHPVPYSDQWTYSSEDAPKMRPGRMLAELERLEKVGEL